jgi:hypothetical protein
MNGIDGTVMEHRGAMLERFAIRFSFVFFQSN